MNIQAGELFNGRYRLISEKGRGAFGEVWLAHDEQIDLDVAVKIYIALDERGIEEFKSEYKTAYSLNHPNLLHAYHFDVIEKRPFLVMPFCPGSAEANIGTTDESLVWRFIRDVSAGLAYLHSRNILHRDIKPDNILSDAEGNFLITDFGVSTKMKSTLRRNSTRSLTDEDISGTIGYMAPELFSKNPEAVKATDIWAFGATIFELINGELPFYGQGGIMLERGAEIPELKGSWSNDLRRTVEACLAKEPWDRPTAAQLETYAAKCVNGNYEKAPWKEPKKQDAGQVTGDSGKTVRFTSEGTDKSSSLTVQERIEICRTCQNRKHDLKTGLYCGLTGQKPDFKSRCNNLVIDQKEVENLQKKKEEIKESNFKYGQGRGIWIGLAVGLILIIFPLVILCINASFFSVQVLLDIVPVLVLVVVGIKALIAYLRRQGRTIPLTITYYIILALNILLFGISWIEIIVYFALIGGYIVYINKSKEINEMFPKNERKWSSFEKVCIAVVASYVVLVLLLFFANNTNRNNVETNIQAKPQTTVTSPAQPAQQAVEKTAPSTNTSSQNVDKGNSTSNSNTSKAQQSSNTGSSNSSTSVEPKKESSNDDNATKLENAVRSKDYATVRKLADSGYAPAYLPLAKYYLNSPSTHDLADKYAQKAKSAGVKGAQDVIDDLNAYGFYD